MTDLSPAAQAIWVAYLDHSKIDETPADLPALAAAIEGLAVELKPCTLSPHLVVLNLTLCCVSATFTPSPPSCVAKTNPAVRNSNDRIS